MIGQWEDSLVFKLRAFGKPEPIHFETEGVLKKGEKGCIAIVFDGEKLLLYHNGEIKNKKRTGPLSFSNWNGSYPLVVGSEGNGSFPWKGNIYSIRIYERALLPGEIEGLVSPENPKRDSDIPLVDYSFVAGGSVIRDHGKGQPADLVIPRRFTPYKRAFLESPHGSLKEIRSDIWDIVTNLFGFIPLGFLLAGYLNRPCWSMKCVILLSVIFGFLLSLTMEVLQAFLPTRDSSMSDLIANTVGTGIGFIAFACLPQAIICSRKLAKISIGA